jgi:hypothetical protein
LSEIEKLLISWFSDPVSEVKEAIEIRNDWLLSSDNNKIEVINFDMHTKYNISFRSSNNHIILLGQKETNQLSKRYRSNETLMLF